MSAKRKCGKYMTDEGLYELLMNSDSEDSIDIDESESGDDSDIEEVVMVEEREVDDTDVEDVRLIGQQPKEKKQNLTTLCGTQVVLYPSYTIITLQSLS